MLTEGKSFWTVPNTGSIATDIPCWLWLCRFRLSHLVWERAVLVTERVSVGIPGVDYILDGGLLRGRAYLLAGSGGTGKTIFSLEWLLAGRAEEKGVYITLSEPTGDVNDNIRSFGWNLDGIGIVDLTPSEDRPRPEDDYDVFPPSDVERAPYWEAIYDAIESHAPQRLVIDSLTNLLYLATDPHQFRKNIVQLVTFLSKRKCTALLLFEPLELQNDPSVGLAVDGVFRLRMAISKARAVGVRDFQVEKMRGSNFLHGVHPLQITSEGIQVYPHITEPIGRTSPGLYQIPSGIAGLDRLLRGGLEGGTTTLLAGPSGVGKSTLAAIFACQSVLLRNEKAVIYSFEESLESLLTRCNDLSIPLSRLIEEGRIKFAHINPMELYPDQFLHWVRQDVKDGCKLLVVDSVRGYEFSMEEFGKPIAHVLNLNTYLCRHGVTTVLTHDSSSVGAAERNSEIGISNLADNILLLRYADDQGRLVKVIGCLKKRVGDFEPEFCELQVTNTGLHVGERVACDGGVVQGIPPLQRRV